MSETELGNILTAHPPPPPPPLPSPHRKNAGTGLQGPDSQCQQSTSAQASSGTILDRRQAV